MQSSVEVPIEWKDPPPAKRGSRPGGKHLNWDLIFAVLRSNPGRWAIVGEGTSLTCCGHIKAGRLGDAEPNEFESCIRDKRLYVRFAPDESAAAS